MLNNRIKHWFKHIMGILDGLTVTDIFQYHSQLVVSYSHLSGGNKDYNGLQATWFASEDTMVPWTNSGLSEPWSPDRLM